MKKIILMMAFTLLGIGQNMAQEADYTPFVREGVKWVYYYDNDFSQNVFDMSEGIQYYSFEMGSDVLIGEKYYKPVILTHYLDHEGKEKEVEDYIPVYLREEGKVVYAIQPEGIMYPQCPVGIYGYVGYPYNGLPISTSKEEFILYDFNDPIALYDSIFETQNKMLEEIDVKYVDYICSDFIPVGNHQSRRHQYKCIYHQNENEKDFVIEGIGYDGTIGMPLFYFVNMISGLTVDYYFSHVIENGQIIYKGKYYDPENMTGIDEVVADKPQARRVDDNYYNLMGQPMGKDIPSTLGIYIHHGKKIIVR
jgi:hypothetical protein